MTIQDRDRLLRGVGSALAIVAVAYAANAVFNHTAWGLRMKAQADLYVFAFFLPFGVIVPAGYIGWVVNSRQASARWLGARLDWRDAVAAAIALGVGGILAAGALGSDLGGASEPHRLFALLLVASIAEVLLFLGVLGNAVQLAMPARWGWRCTLLTLIVSSLAFGFFHFTYPTPWNTLGHALGLTLVWVPVSLLFLVTRSLLGPVILNNMLAVIGFVKNGIPLPGTSAAGWFQAALACVLIVTVLHLMARRQRAT